jgi:enoyl reductase-like protein
MVVPCLFLNFFLKKMQITTEEVAKALVADGRSVRYAALAIGKPETTVLFSQFLCRS